MTQIREKATAVLGRISARLARGLEPASGPLVNAICHFWRRRFESGGSLGGSPWAPLSEATIERHGWHPLLQHTGTLWASLTQEGATGLTKRGKASSRAFVYAVLDADRKGLHVGSWDPVLSLLSDRQVAPDEVPASDAGR